MCQTRMVMSSLLRLTCQPRVTGERKLLKVSELISITVTGLQMMQPHRQLGSLIVCEWIKWIWSETRDQHDPHAIFPNRLLVPSRMLKRLQFMRNIHHLCCFTLHVLANAGRRNESGSHVTPAKGGCRLLPRADPLIGWYGVSEGWRSPVPPLAIPLPSFWLHCLCLKILRRTSGIWTAVDEYQLPTCHSLHASTSRGTKAVVSVH
ncbi:hypothetical protein J3F84DRAFT_78102 [Trichoderma pleuroticola]